MFPCKFIVFNKYLSECTGCSKKEDIFGISSDRDEQHSFQPLPVTRGIWLWLPTSMALTQVLQSQKKKKNFQRETKFKVNSPVTAGRLPVKNQVQYDKSLVTGG